LPDIYRQINANSRQAINAADRSTLNNALLDELEQTPNVKLFFNHKLTGADFHANKAWFERRLPGETPIPNSSNRAPEIEVSFDFLVGSDGAHSATRYHLMKFARVNYEQEYIDALWCEFRIPPTEDGNFRISPKHLHIWPGTEFMFIAIPSSDKSFTCTLFAPAQHYIHLQNSPETLVDFFDTHFPGVCPDLITPDALTEQFSTNPHLPLISIKCTPHHFNSSAVILGDAAHAVLPFYGQGLNAGFEDVRVLFDILDSHGVYTSPSPESRTFARHTALQAYTSHRTPDTHAINDLSKTNYLEMRWGVKTPLYKLRKTFEETLDRYFPRLGWKTQYARVSFSTQRYSEVVRAAHWQGQLLALGVGFVGVWGTVMAAMGMWKSPGPKFQVLVRGLSHLWVRLSRNAAKSA
jgi:kynurenine 3-monooxygenase